MALHHVKRQHFAKGVYEEEDYALLEVACTASTRKKTKKTNDSNEKRTVDNLGVIENDPRNNRKNARHRDRDAGRSSSSSSSSSSSASDASVLSSRGLRNVKIPRRVPETLLDRWVRSERHFDKRERLLRRICIGKSKAFLRQIRERELLVRHQAFDSLLLADDTELKSVPTRLGHKRVFAEGDHQKPLSYSRCFGNWVIFELNSIVPAVFSLIVHSIVHICIYDGLHACVDFVRRNVTNTTGVRPLIDLCVTGTIFFVGVLLIRSTGDLYWWASDQHYDVIKIDFRNRLRLSYWDARVISIVRARDFLRITMFTVGYHFCYSSTSQFHFSMERYFDRSEHVTTNLPSTQFNEEHGMCLARRDESFCAQTCQEEIAWQGKPPDKFDFATRHHLNFFLLPSALGNSMYVRGTETCRYGIHWVCFIAGIVRHLLERLDQQRRSACSGVGCRHKLPSHHLLLWISIHRDPLHETARLSFLGQILSWLNVTFAHLGS